MGKVSEERRKLYFFKIYEQICENAFVEPFTIALKTRISRNTVTKCLKEMYARTILVGPHLVLNPAPDYTEYVYLLDSDDPLSTYEDLKKSPHTVYAALTFGGWNVTLITTERDISLEKVVKKGVRRLTSTPKIDYVSWEEGLQAMSERLQSLGKREFRLREPSPRLDWGEDQWKLFCTFYNPRKKVTPLLKKIKVRYETYIQWKKDLKNHCSIDTRFCLHGFKNCVKYSFLISTEYPFLVKSLFSLLPVSPLVTEIDDDLLISTAVHSPDSTKKLFHVLHGMKKKGIIQDFTHVGTISEHEGDPYFRFFEEVDVKKVKLRF